MNILPLLDELRVMAQTGRFWAERNDHPYDRERYERILELVADYYHETLDVPIEEARGQLAQDLDLGYVTPNIGVKTAIFDEDGRILLMQRPDEPVKGSWDIPGGAVEPLEPPAETAVRELQLAHCVGLVVRDDQSAQLLGPSRTPVSGGAESLHGTGTGMIPTLNKGSTFSRTTRGTPQ